MNQRNIKPNHQTLLSMNKNQKGERSKAHFRSIRFGPARPSTNIKTSNLGCFLLNYQKCNCLWFNGKPIRWQKAEVLTSKQNEPKKHQTKPSNPFVHEQKSRRGKVKSSLQVDSLWTSEALNKHQNCLLNCQKCNFVWLIEKPIRWQKAKVLTSKQKPKERFNKPPHQTSKPKSPNLKHSTNLHIKETSNHQTFLGERSKAHFRTVSPPPPPPPPPVVVFAFCFQPFKPPQAQRVHVDGLHAPLHGMEAARQVLPALPAPSAHPKALHLASATQIEQSVFCFLFF